MYIFLELENVPPLLIPYMYNIIRNTPIFHFNINKYILENSNSADLLAC